ncbi:MAG: glycosyltransferase [Planctomycetota bacterium]
MRLLYVVHQFFPDCHSGTEQYCLAIAREAERRGADVTVLSLDWRHDREKPPVEVAATSFEGIRVLRLNHWRKLNPNDILRDYQNRHLEGFFQEVMEDLQPQAVHFFHLRQIGSNLIHVANRFGARTVVNLMDFWYLCPRFTLLRSDNTLCDGPPDGGLGCIACEYPGLEGFEPSPGPAPLSEMQPARLRALLDRPERQLRNLKAADTIAAPSRFLAKMFERNGLPQERMTIVPYGLPSDRILRRDRKLPNTPLRISFCGVLSPWKAPRLLVDAVCASTAAFKLTVHGRTDEPMFQSYIDNMVEAADGNENIQFPGPYGSEEIGDVFDQTDILVVPSVWYENTPFVVLEAFAAGVPVVASDLGGLSELINESNGWLFEAGDTHALKALLEALAKDPDQILKRTPASPPSIAENYDTFDAMYRQRT